MYPAAVQGQAGLVSTGECRVHRPESGAPDPVPKQPWLAASGLAEQPRPSDAAPELRVHQLQSWQVRGSVLQVKPCR